MNTTLLVSLYLIIIVFANLFVLHFGQPALLLSAVVLVPFDFAVRTELQSRWSDQNLWLKLLSLMIAGGLLTVMTIPEAGQIAFASVVAFICSSIGGAVAFKFFSDGILSHDEVKILTVGVMSIIDSFLFPILAFDSVNGLLIIFQVFAKWSVAAWIIHLDLFPIRPRRSHGSEKYSTRHFG